MYGQEQYHIFVVSFTFMTKVKRLYILRKNLKGEMEPLTKLRDF